MEGAVAVVGVPGTAMKSFDEDGEREREREKKKPENEKKKKKKPKPLRSFPPFLYFCFHFFTFFCSEYTQQQNALVTSFIAVSWSRGGGGGGGEENGERRGREREKI